MRILTRHNPIPEVLQVYPQQIRHRYRLCMTSIALVLAAFAWPVPMAGAEPQEKKTNTVPRCRVVPVPHRSFEFQIDGATRATWHAPNDVPRPYLYPLIGPSGQSVTRMGHPGAPDHDHHRSVWFAHFKVNGSDFWSENGGTRIRQTMWYCMEDDLQAARLACQLEWLDANAQPLILQDVAFELRALPNDEISLEVQTWLRPAKPEQEITLEKTNFGLFATRVSKSISEVFGQGTLTSDGQLRGEPAIFGKTHRWVDYSGLSPVVNGNQSSWAAEGLTYFDHPHNPGFPNGWHVRADGWMCASPTMFTEIPLHKQSPLVLRYLLHVHDGPYDQEKAEAMQRAFANRPGWVLQKSDQPHIRYELKRLGTEQQR